MNVAIVTASYDNYDTLKELPSQTVEHEAIFVTDNPELTATTWKVRYAPSRGVHPNLAAKRPKMCPWRYTDADIVIWLDASFRVTSNDFVAAMLDYLPFGQFEHPDRDCIYDEALISAQMPKYAGLPILEQAAEYKSWNHPAHWGLWAAGVSVRERSERIELFGESWLIECEDWSYQDQISQPPLLRDYELRPRSLPGSHIHNPWLAYEGSTRH